MSISSTTTNSPLLPDTASTTATWRCVPCDVKGYSVEARLSHLSGKKHRKTMATTGAQTEMSTPPRIAGTIMSNTSPATAKIQSTLSLVNIADGPIVSFDAPMWLCAPCRTKGMNAAAKETHIAGKKHRKIIGAASDQTGIIAQTEISPPPPLIDSGTVILPDSPLWRCVPCDTKGESVVAKEAHFSGRKHRRIVGATSEQTDIIVTPGENPSLPPPGVNEDITSGAMWSCHVCGDLKMPLSCKPSHLRGRKHQKKSHNLSGNTENPNISGRRDAPTVHPTAGAPSGSTSSRMCSTVRPVASSSTEGWGWFCKVCKKTLPLFHKEAHFSGILHRTAAKSYSRPSNPSEPDISDPDDSSSDEDDLRQPRRRVCRKYDYDRDELAGLIRDIDTQWGMIPGGGAYKESNHYYGPGIYDYY